MKNLIVHTVAAAGLFAGALVGMLAFTGRLNHEGTRGIPLIADFFPAPKDDATAGENPEKNSESVPAQQPEGRGPVLQKGRSVFEPEPEPATDTHGEGETADGHAEDDAKTKTGEDAATQSPQGGESETRTPTTVPPRGQGPGGYFRFEGMPAGLSADKINDYWRRAREAGEELDRRTAALDLRENDLRALEQDIAERQTEVARQRSRIEEMQRELEARIQEFHRQVKLVRSDEVAALKRNAQTLASFEPAKAAELVQDQWKSDPGQELVLKTLEVMDRDAANAILAELPKGLIRDVLEKRLRVSREKTENGR